MKVLENKIDFVALITVTNANPNGDPLNGNRPRTTYTGNGEISDVCIKRKIRNRLQDMGESIFVQSDERCDDGYGSLSERAGQTITSYSSKEDYAAQACAKWFDVRRSGRCSRIKRAKRRTRTAFRSAFAVRFRSVRQSAFLRWISTACRLPKA